MSRHFAHRPRHHLLRVQPQPLRHSHQDYLRQRWTYRQQHAFFTKRPPLGYSLAFIPYGWQLARTNMRLRA